MKRVLVIGSSGMLGTDLSQELSRDYEVIGADVISIKPRGLAGDISFIECDITKKQSILNVVKKCHPDIVIHTAAMTDVDGCELNPKKAYKINGEGTRNVALACKAIDVTLIYISTDFVFDGKKKRPYMETDKVRPLSVYGDSKLKGELAVTKILKKYFILRTSWLYGKHGKNFVDTIIAKSKEGKALRVVDDQVGSPTYTKDLAKAIRILLEKVFKQPPGLESRQLLPNPGGCEWYGIYNVSNSGAVSWFDYARQILRLAGSKTKVVPISSRELSRPAKRPAMSVLDKSKFSKLTGHNMRNWCDALKVYINPGGLLEGLQRKASHV